jgi:Poly A polymerase head domain
MSCRLLLWMCDLALPPWPRAPRPGFGEEGRTRLALSNRLFLGTETRGAAQAAATKLNRKCARPKGCAEKSDGKFRESPSPKRAEQHPLCDPSDEKENTVIDKSMIDPNALQFYRVLKEAGFSAYFVGGSVRDLLLGKSPKDFDIATNATPQQIKRVIPQGLRDRDLPRPRRGGRTSRARR